MITEHDDDYVGDVVKKESKENKRNVFSLEIFLALFSSREKKQKTTIGFVCPATPYLLYMDQYIFERSFHSVARRSAISMYQETISRKKSVSMRVVAESLNGFPFHRPHADWLPQLVGSFSLFFTNLSRFII